MSGPYDVIAISARFLDDTEIAERLPWLNPEGVVGVVYEPDGGYADPMQTTEAFVKGFRDLGGEVNVNTPVRELRERNARPNEELSEENASSGSLSVTESSLRAKA